MIALDSFEFYVRNDKLAISVDCPVAEIDSLTWDTKNTIILSMADGKQYLLTNILPDVREVLAKIETAIVIFMHEQEVAEAYEVKLTKDSALEYDDLFNEEALSCYQEFEELRKKQIT